jgi:hypothetical protein
VNKPMANGAYSDEPLKLNPLRWKPEHRAFALVCAAGAAVGIAIGFLKTRGGGPRWRGDTFTQWVAHDPAGVIMWAVVGALVIGAVVYCYRIFSVRPAEDQSPAASSRRPVDERVSTATRQRHPGSAR